MSNIDDIVSDMKRELLHQILDSAVIRSNLEKVEFPEEQVNKWYEKLWYYNVSEWKPCVDDRAFPDTHYGYGLADVLEYRAYELRTEVMDYIRDHALKQ